MCARVAGRRSASIQPGKFLTLWKDADIDIFVLIVAAAYLEFGQPSLRILSSSSSDRAASEALDAIQHTLQVRKDGGLGRQLLTDIGVIPSAEERFAIASQPMNIETAALTPFEVAMIEDEEGQMRLVAYGCACAMEAGAEAFGISYRQRWRFATCKASQGLLTKSQAGGSAKYA